MAIGTGAQIEVFGTQDEVTVASPGAVVPGAFSSAADVVDWVNDDDTHSAMFVLVLNDLSAAAAAGDTIDLYCKPLDIVNATGDHQGPGANIESIYLGSFLIDATDPGGVNENYGLGPKKLPNFQSSQGYEFFIQNNTTVSILSASWELWVTPKSEAPRP